MSSSNLEEHINDFLWIEYDNDGEGHIRGTESLAKYIEGKVETEKEKLVKDIKMEGYGYDDVTGFVLKISFEKLNSLLKEKS